MNGRNNNFNLLRMMGALLIMFAHAMFITIGDDINFETYPVKYTLGITCLNLFFVLSGMLVTSSWLKHKSLITYGVSRAMRIFPGLIVVAFVTAFVIGPLMTNESLSQYFSDLRSWVYWPLTSLLYPDITLPGVFEGLPNDGVVNAPLWTLRYEAFFYVCVALMGILGWFGPRYFGWLAMLGFAVYVCVSFFTDLRSVEAVDHFMHFGYAFLIGSCLHIFARFIPVSLPLSLVCMGLSIGVVTQFGLQSGEILLIPSAALLGLWIAYVPGGVLRYYNGLGDFSYGVYIWHYPIEQIMYSKFGYKAPMELYLHSLPFVLIVAALSWYLIEKPGLVSIKHIVAYLKQRVFIKA